MESKPAFQNTCYTTCCLFYPQSNNMLGSITGALYSLSVLVSCIAVKDTSQLLLRSNTSVSSCCLSAVVHKMLKLCPRSFHVWGSKLKSGCIIFMAAEKNQELCKLTRLLKAFTLMMHMLHLLMFHWPIHIMRPDSTSMAWDVQWGEPANHIVTVMDVLPFNRKLRRELSKCLLPMYWLTSKSAFYELTLCHWSWSLLVQRASQVALVVKNLPANAGDIKRCGFNPWMGNIPWRRKWQPTPVFLPRKSHGQRSLEGSSPWGHRKSPSKRFSFRPEGGQIEQTNLRILSKSEYQISNEWFALSYKQIANIAREIVIHNLSEF